MFAGCWGGTRRKGGVSQASCSGLAQELPACSHLSSHCLAREPGFRFTVVTWTPIKIAATQSLKRPPSAQAMISRFMSSSPASGSVLTAQGLDPALDSLSPSLSVPPLLAFFLSLTLSLSKINIKKIVLNKLNEHLKIIF